MMSMVVDLVSKFGIVLWLSELDISLLLRIVSIPKTLNGQNQSDESWTWGLIMCLGGPNLEGRLGG